MNSKQTENEICQKIDIMKNTILKTEEYQLSPKELADIIYKNKGDNFGLVYDVYAYGVYIGFQLQNKK